MLLIQYWHTDDMPDYIADWTASFRTQNPGLDHRIFTRATAEQFIANNFSSREVTAFRACGPPSTQANYLRYCAVLTLGGIYSDVDFRCIGPLTPLEDRTEGGTLFTRRGVVPNNFFAFRFPGHPFLRLTLEVATARIEKRDPKDDSWLACGPAIFTYMHYLFQAGSLEEFTAKYSGDEYTRDYPEFLASVIGEYSRIRQAFDGIRVLPWADARTWVRPMGGRAPYKETNLHWTKWRGSIFR